MSCERVITDNKHNISYDLNFVICMQILFFLGGGHEMYNFFVSLSYRCYILSLVKIGQEVIEKKM